MTTKPMTTTHREFIGTLLLHVQTGQPMLGRHSSATLRLPSFPSLGHRGRPAQAFVDERVRRAEVGADAGLAAIDDDGRVAADPVTQRLPDSLDAGRVNDRYGDAVAMAFQEDVDPV